jgi:hypothetical protein
MAYRGAPNFSKCPEETFGGSTGKPVDGHCAVEMPTRAFENKGTPIACRVYAARWHGGHFWHRFNKKITPSLLLRNGVLMLPHIFAPPKVKRREPVLNLYNLRNGLFHLTHVKLTIFLPTMFL